MKTRKGYTVYPLTVAQKFHFFYLDACVKKAVVNIGTSLTIETELDFDILRECILEAYNRSESMRLMFVKDKDGTWYQYVVDKAEPEIPFVDFSDKTISLRKTLRNHDEPIVHPWVFLVSFLSHLAFVIQIVYHKIVTKAVIIPKGV